MAARLVVALDEAELRRQAAALIPDRNILRQLRSGRAGGAAIAGDLTGDDREADAVPVADETTSSARGEGGDRLVIARRDHQVGGRQRDVLARAGAAGPVERGDASAELGVALGERRREQRRKHAVAPSRP